MRKQRTREHVIEALGFNYVERHILYAGYTVMRYSQGNDYGYDGLVQTYNEQGIVDFSIMRKERDLEVAMQQIPEKVRKISDTALNSVFAKDIAKLDENSIEVLNKVVKYLEKKYISVPIKMAKEILSKENSFRNN